MEPINLEVRSRVDRSLDLCAIYSVTGNANSLSQEMARLMKAGYSFSGLNIALDDENGGNTVVGIEDGTLWYDCEKKMVVSVSGSPGTHTQGSSQGGISGNEFSGLAHDPLDIVRGRVRDDGPLIMASDYDLSELCEDRELLMDALKKGFVNINFIIREIQGLIPDVDTLSSDELLNRITDSVVFLIKQAHYVLKERYNSNEYILSSADFENPFNNFRWMDFLGQAGGEEFPTAGGLRVISEILPTKALNTPFLDDECELGDSLQRVTATAISGEREMSFFVVDCLMSGPRVVGISQETRVQLTDAVRPGMLVARSVFIEKDGPPIPPAERSSIDRESVELWTPQYGPRRQYKGYGVTTYDSRSGYIVHEIDPQDYDGLLTQNAAVAVPSTVRAATINEVRAYIQNINKRRFVIDHAMDSVWESLRRLNNEDV